MGKADFMKQKKYYIIGVPVVIILFLIGVILYYLFADPARLWYCSLTEPRGDDVEAWQKIITPAKPSVQLDEEFFDHFIVGSDAEYFTV